MTRKKVEVIFTGWMYEGVLYPPNDPPPILAERVAQAITDLFLQEVKSA